MQTTKKTMLRYDIINYLIKKNDYRKYLEIGVEGGDAFRNINCQTKHGVDPASPHAVFKIPSDEFFEMLHPDYKYDMIFVDGLHVEDQVDRDLENSLNHLNEGGIIVVHDCNPPSEWHQRSYEEAQKNGCRQWNGTVWRSLVKLRAMRSDLSVEVVNTDWGCGLVRKLRENESPNILVDVPEKLEYSYLEKNRNKALNLISIQEFLERY